MRLIWQKKIACLQLTQRQNFKKSFEKQKLELEANLEKRASVMACRLLASTTGVKLSRIPDSDTCFASSGDGILAQLERITEPTAKGKFYAAHKAEIQSAFNQIAARRVELENKLKAEGTL